MLFHVFGLLCRNQGWLVALASVICLAACYAAVSSVSNLMAFSEGSLFGPLAAATAALGLGIALTQYGFLVGVTPLGSLKFDPALVTGSLAIALLGAGAGLWVTMRWHNWTAAGGAVIGLAAAATNYISLLAIGEQGRTHQNVGLVVLAGLAGVLLCGTALPILRVRGALRNRFASASMLMIGVVALDILSDMSVSVHSHFTGAPEINAIAEHWLAIGAVPAALVILMLSLFANAIGRHVRELADAKQKLEDAMQDLQRALELAEQAKDARSQVLAHMSHELRTPLNAIIGFSDLIGLESFGKIGDRYHEYIQIIHDSGSHLLGLINQVLDLAKVDAGRFELHEEEIDVARAIDGCVQLMSCQARNKGIALSANIASDLPMLYADASVIRQIIVNLLSNAVKFTPEGGTVETSVACFKSCLRISVKDTGIGIRSADLPRIFERFGQIDNIYSRTHHGTGLGLPLVKEFVEAHQGSLSVDSALGEGTTILVTFPQERLRPPSAAPATEPVNRRLAAFGSRPARKSTAGSLP